MGSITSHCKQTIKDNFKILTWIQIFIIAIAPNFIFLQATRASTLTDSGWSASKALVQGATTTYNGAKNILINGKNYAATGVATVTPTAAQVGKMIVRTGATVAVTVAVEQLIGAVDWVLDPDNNQIKYWSTDVPFPPNSCAASKNLSFAGVTGSLSTVLSKLNQIETARRSGYFAFDSITVTDISCTSQSVRVTYTAVFCTSNCAPSVAYTYGDPANKGMTSTFTVVAGSPVQDEPKILPLDTVAQQIISNAQAENSDAKAYVSSVADTALEQDEQRQIVGADVVAQQLNNSQSISTSQNATGQITAQPTVDPATGQTTQPKPTDISLNFPVFCSWAPTVCQAAQAGINYVASYTKDVDALKKEYADNPKFNDKPLEFPDDPPLPDTNINFGGFCPNSLFAPYSFMGISGAIEFSFTPLCKIAEISKPVIIAVSAYFAALIVGGIRSGDA